jgi:hypothetical protein
MLWVYCMLQKYMITYMMCWKECYFCVIEGQVIYCMQEENAADNIETGSEENN